MDILKMTTAERHQRLGQVFTEEAVAAFMAKECVRTASDRGLDPCFGDGALLAAVAARLSSIAGDDSAPRYERQLNGVEIDPDLYAKGYQRLRQSAKARRLPGLTLGDFFDLQPPSELYDFVIVNPPYVRQELLDKAYLRQIEREEVPGGSPQPEGRPSRLPGRANLYLYFLARMGRFLRPGGRLVAITYDSWLYTAYGEALKDIYLRDYELLKVVRLAGSAFNEALIDTCIVVLNKKDQAAIAIPESRTASFVKAEVRLMQTRTDAIEQRKVVRVVATESIRKSTLASTERWDVFFRRPSFHDQLMRLDRWVRLDELCSLKRGAEPISARFFVKSAAAWEQSGVSARWLVPIMKNPKDLICMHTKGQVQVDYYLCPDGPIDAMESDPDGKSAIRYLREIAREVRRNPHSYPGLVAAIGRAPDSWFIHPRPEVPDLFFSYIIRNRKIFWLNDGRVGTSDNFANLFTRVSVPALFGLLNSTLMQYQLELNARRQGSGLAKLQIFELKAIPVPDLRQAPRGFVADLEGAALRLVAVETGSPAASSEAITNIDLAVWKYMRIDTDTAGAIRKAEQELRDERLRSSYEEG
jgi:methylase of polypeptide subunit release factors